MKAAYLFLVVLLIIQYITTKPTDFFHLTEIEGVEQLKRMNEYPLMAYRVANWIEAREESIIYFKLERNLTKTFDLQSLFGGLFKPLLLPVFIYGFFELIRKKTGETLIFFLTPVALLTVIGHSSRYGPISLYPIIFASCFFGFFLIIKSFINHEK